MHRAKKRFFAVLLLLLLLHGHNLSMESSQGFPPPKQATFIFNDKKGKQKRYRAGAQSSSGQRRLTQREGGIHTKAVIDSSRVPPSVPEQRIRRGWTPQPCSIFTIPGARLHRKQYPPPLPPPSPPPSAARKPRLFYTLPLIAACH